MADTRVVQGGFLQVVPGGILSLGMGGTTGMSNLGVHCCCGMPVPTMAVPPSSPSKFLGKGAWPLQGSWWCVLRVRPIGLSTEGSWECRFACWSILRQLASQSFLVCHPSCTVVPSHPTLISSYSFPPCFLLVDPFEFGLCPVSPQFFLAN